MSKYFFPLILAFCTYQREKTLAGNEEEKTELFIDENQQIRENAENYEREMLTMIKNRNMIYQGMYENHKILMKFIKNNYLL